jgi:hypothetical protein
MAVAKVICEEIVEGETVLRSWTTTQGGAAVLVKTKPGLNKPYWCWPSVPAGTIIAADFTGAPLATSNTAENAAAIAAITATPEEKLTYE